MESSDATAQAIEQLYCLYYQPVLHYLEHLVQQYESAEDLCQETFLKVFKHRDQLGEAACVRGWLYRIATNTAYDYLRRQRRIAFTALPEEATWIAATAIETRWDVAEPVWNALCRLCAHYRVPLVLQSIGGYSLDDIPATLGCSPASAKTGVHRGRKQFRQHYTA
ncbi:MAG TPA: RNA polymerase sigma factor [Roseiflexaceae bacterium]|nr:RNA polymerase sigma factor [Roseiflexaceae bacterium]